MPLPAPNLDDRRFQDLVDDAKRLVQRRCPEWTDHNVSDPGITLIETFAYVVDQVLYRLNRVPERSYITFLDLMGVELFAPSAATAPVTFWLTAALAEDRVIEAGTEVATRRLRTSEAIVFRTIDDLHILHCRRTYVMTGGAGTQPFDQSAELANERLIAAFAVEPQVGDTLFVGLDRATPSCAVSIHVECTDEPEGHGIDPTNPPWIWEALGQDGWTHCDIEDSTDGFNTTGDVIVHVPASHTEAVLEERSGGWLRCRLVTTEGDQTPYLNSPLLRSVEASTVGGTTWAADGEDVVDELIGVSEGVPGQHFALVRRPVVASEHPVQLEIAGPDGWQRWHQVQSFGESGADDQHWRLNANDGTVHFGPAVRLADGTLKQYGEVPPAGAHVRVRRYRTGGGSVGNVTAHEIVTLKSAIPFVGRVDNRRPASGGVDGETLDAAKARGPLVLGTRNRAVTTRDYEQLAREATPQVARVRCLAVDDAGRPDDEASGAGVRVLIVPSVAADEEGRFTFDQLVPSDSMMDVVRTYLDERRMVGARVVVTPPRYLGMTAVIRVRPRPHADPDHLRADVVQALYRYFDPLRGGPEGEGWDFGRPVILGEVFGVAQRIEGVDLIEDARMFPADPLSGRRGDAVTRIDLDPDSLVFSYGHQVQVVRT